MSRVRFALHARASPGGDHGFLRRGVRGLLPLQEHPASRESLNMLKPIDNVITFSFPVPIQDYPQVLLAHGGGGKLMQQLIDKMFTSTFSRQSPRDRHDSAVLPAASGRLAFTTDSYVVHPLIFPGGDIGTLAVNGTVNDLAMAGARPLYLSLSFILEEGLSMDTLWRITHSIPRP